MTGWWIGDSAGSRKSRLKPAVQRRPTAVGLVLLLILAACGTSEPSTLYRPPCNTCGRPSLIDAEIRMTTHWTGGTDEVPDVRVVVCDQGRITCYIETATNVRREGPVCEADWQTLWARLDPVTPWAPFPPVVKPNDPTGGPYHLVQLRAGSQMSQFSSQNRADLLVFSSREAADRLQYSNLIVDFVAKHARTSVESLPPPPAPPTAVVPAGDPKKP